MCRSYGLSDSTTVSVHEGVASILYDSPVVWVVYECVLLGDRFIFICCCFFRTGYFCTFLCPSIFSSANPLVRLANELLSTDPRRAEAWVVIALYSQVRGEKEKAVSFVDKVLV